MNATLVLSAATVLLLDAISFKLISNRSLLTSETLTHLPPLYFLLHRKHAAAYAPFHTLTICISVIIECLIPFNNIVAKFREYALQNMNTSNDCHIENRFIYLFLCTLFHTKQKREPQPTIYVRTTYISFHIFVLENWYN